MRHNRGCISNIHLESKTIVELVQATDHASKMGYQLLIPLYCNQWGKARGVLSPYYLLFTWMNSQSSWDQPGWDALWEIWL